MPKTNSHEIQTELSRDLGLAAAMSIGIGTMIAAGIFTLSGLAVAHVGSAAIPAAGMWLLIAGRLSHTLGVTFFAWRRLPHHHAVWHLFVLAGSACHFFAVLLFV